MTTSALVATGHGYEKSDLGRCTAFDGFEILANPLGGDRSADREKRVFKSKSGEPGVTYDSFELYLLRKVDAHAGERTIFVGMHHGGGRLLWAIPACYNYSRETLEALLAMPERALYSLLYGIATALDDTRRAAIEETRQEWQRATVQKRVKISRQPSKGRAFAWIEPERLEGESEQSHKLRCIFAKPAGVR